MKDAEDSRVIRFLSMVWTASPRSKSWPQLNRSMLKALKVAIMSGMKFELGDVAEIADRFNWVHWASYPEGLYDLAARGAKSHGGRLPKNISAAQSFEAYWRRPPYILGGRRLVVGSRFDWEGELVTVTSIGAESLIACAYSEPGKVARRFYISRKALKDMERMERAAKASSPTEESEAGP